MKLIFAISIVALSFFGTACRRSVGEMILVPMPQEATFTGGYFETDSARFVERAGDGYVACRIDPSAPEIRPEGYRLKVTRRGIDLTALDSAGLFYGRQTLCLLATAQGIPCVEIIDNPCFGYRGIHLDVSRHFFPLKRYSGSSMKWHGTSLTNFISTWRITAAGASGSTLIRC